MTVIATWDGLEIDPDLLSALGGYGYNVTVTYDGQDQPRFLAYMNAAVNQVAADLTTTGSSATAAAASAATAATQASNASTSATNAASSATAAASSATSAASSATAAAASAASAAGYVVPSQTGNSGKYLTTNGTAVSWGTVDALPSQTGNSGKFLTTNGTSASWAAGVSTATMHAILYS